MRISPMSWRRAKRWGGSSRKSLRSSQEPLLAASTTYSQVLVRSMLLAVKTVTLTNLLAQTKESCSTSSRTLTPNSKRRRKSIKLLKLRKKRRATLKTGRSNACPIMVRLRATNLYACLSLTSLWWFLTCSYYSVCFSWPSSSGLSAKKRCLWSKSTCPTTTRMCYRLPCTKYLLWSPSASPLSSRFWISGWSL